MYCNHDDGGASITSGPRPTAEPRAYNQRWSLDHTYVGTLSNQRFTSSFPGQAFQFWNFYYCRKKVPSISAGPPP